MAEPLKAVVWRWKGTRADIVRIAKSVAELTGDARLAAEVVDRMGAEQLQGVDQLAAALEGRESFVALGIEGGWEGGPCHVMVLFADPSASAAAVTIVADGSDAAAVQAAHASIQRLTDVGAREPKNVEPSSVEMWGGIAGIGLSIFGALLIFAGVGEEDPEFVAAGTVVASIGVAGVWVWLGYETLVPQLELLHQGKSPRVQVFALWFAGIVASLALTAMFGLG